MIQNPYEQPGENDSFLEELEGFEPLQPMQKRVGQRQKAAGVTSPYAIPAPAVGGGGAPPSPYTPPPYQSPPYQAPAGQETVRATPGAGTAASRIAGGGSPYSGGSFQDWFMSQVKDKPYNQKTLLGMEEILKQSGSKLTGANAEGEQTKIWDPTINDWVRVGFGEGKPVWIPQGWGASGASASGGSGGAEGSGGDAGGGNDSDYIERLLERGFSPVSGDDPAIRAQFDPISATIQRGAQRSRDSAAERMAFQGTNVGGAGGALDAEINKINEGATGQEGEAMSAFIGEELLGRRQDIYQALQFSQGAERIRLERELGRLDAQIRQLGINTGAATSRYAIDTQDRQWYDAFDYGMSKDEYEMNRDYQEGL